MTRLSGRPCFLVRILKTDDQCLKSGRWQVPRLDSMAGRLVSCRASHQRATVVQVPTLIAQVFAGYVYCANTSRTTGTRPRVSAACQYPASPAQASRPAAGLRPPATSCCLARGRGTRVREHKGPQGTPVQRLQEKNPCLSLRRLWIFMRTYEQPEKARAHPLRRKTFCLFSRRL